MDNQDAGASTSPLAILKQAPTVHIQDRTTRPPTQPTKKPGIVRGVIGAIPFIGPKLAGTNKKPTVAPVMTPDSQEHGNEMPPGPPPVLYPPPPDPNDPVTTPTHFVPPATGGMMIGGRVPPPAEGTEPDVPSGRRIEVKVGSPEPAQGHGIMIDQGATISVKPESTHAPEVSGDEKPTPKPASEEPAAKAPEVEATPTPEPTPVPTPIAEARQSSPSLESTDLAMPNPKVEENEVIRGEFESAVREGRAGSFSLAARHFREYGDNHPSSGLAPRALFLAAIMESDPAKADEAAQALKKTHPDSKYVDELAQRKPADETAPSGNLLVDAQTIEQKLESAPDDKSVQIALRKKLASIYLKLDQPDRALEVLKTANGIAEGTPEEGEVLALTAEAEIAGKDISGASDTLNDLVQRFPEIARRPRVRLSMGLVNEEAGYYQRAAANYSALIQESPSSPEAKTAAARLKDMNRLSE